MLKTAASGLGFQHLPRDLTNVNAWKAMFYPYININRWMFIDHDTAALQLNQPWDEVHGLLYFHILGLSLASSNEKWHLASQLDRVCRCASIMRKNIKLFQRNKERKFDLGFVSINEKGIWEWLWLYLVNISLMCIQNFIEMSNMVWRPRPFPCFHIFWLRLSLGQWTRHCKPID